MSKNIIVQENGVAENYTAEVIRTTKTDGGTCDWVPEDEVQLTKKTIKKSGEYKAEDDGYYGYEEVTVKGHKNEDVKTKRKTITANSTYYARDDGVYGFSSVYVNVKGTGDFDDGSGTVHPDPTPDPGRAVVGEDPETGNEQMVYIDEDHNIKRRDLASYILLDTPPNKLEYLDGERIVMSGAVVRGYLADGTPYKNASYHDSILPFIQSDSTGGEYDDTFLPGGVVFPTPLYADVSQAEGGEGGSASIDYSLPTFERYFTQPLYFAKSVHMETTYYDRYYDETGQLTLDMSIDDGVLVPYSSSSGTYISFLAFSKNRNAIITETRVGSGGAHAGSYDATLTNGVSSQQFATLKNHEWFSYQSVGMLGWIKEDAHFMFNNTKAAVVYSDNLIREMGTVLFDGETEEYDGSQTITLTWPREGDRKFLTTTFEIDVTSSN